MIFECLNESCSNIFHSISKVDDRDYVCCPKCSSISFRVKNETVLFQVPETTSDGVLNSDNYSVLEHGIVDVSKHDNTISIEFDDTVLDKYLDVNEWMSSFITALSLLQKDSCSKNRS